MKLLKKEEELRELNKNLELRVKKALKENDRQREELFQERKRAVMGELIGIIAHQLKQPLNVISLLTSNLIFDFEEDGELTEEILIDFERDILKTVDFMGKSIDDFRNFFRPDKIPKNYNLKNSIERAINIISVSLSGKGIELSSELDETISVNGIDSEFQQVILNLISNAKDALIQKRVKAPKIEIKSYIEDMRAVVIVSDNAGGVSEDIIDKIFNSYFTTKGERGTGIGLNLAKMIIESMEGSIDVANSERGAIFTIKPPLHSF